MKKHGHYCKVCGEYKANEKFSGKGHASHIGMPASSTIKKWMVHRPERNGGILRCQFRKWRIFWG